jgi:glycosyltransferase involved in cell wall biosynthesis
MKPEISVITTVYNCEKYISESVNSITEQTFGNFEYIIVNDGSTDKTLVVLEKLAEKDKRIKIIKNDKNLGRVKSLNLALERAVGKFIAIQDADDISLTDRFEIQISFFGKNPDYVLLGSDISVIDHSGKLISKPERPETDAEIKFCLLFKCTLANPSIMFRKEISDKYNIRYEPDFSFAEDFRIFTHIIRYGKVHNLRNKLILYRDHSVNSSNRNIKIISHDSAKVVSDNFKELGMELNIEDAVRIRRLISSKELSENHLYKDMKLLFTVIKTFQERNGNIRNAEVLKMLKRMLKWPGKKNLLIKPQFTRLQISILNYYYKQAKLKQQTPRNL